MSRLGSFGNMLHGLFEGRGACEDVVSRVAGQAEAVMHVGPAQVGIDQQHAGVALRQDAGEVAGGGGLAFRGRGAGEQDELGRAAGSGKQQRGAQRAEGSVNCDFGWVSTLMLRCAVDMAAVCSALERLALGMTASEGSCITPSIS